MDISYRGIINSAKVPEANIQAEFYMLCRKHNIPVLLEIKYKNCRFDAVVFKNDKPIAIVEVKNYSIKTSTRGLKKTSRQWIKYNSFGLPVIELLNSKMIFNAFDEVVRIYNLNQNTSC